MSLLFNLPDDLVRDILSNWFELNDMYSMDCALLSNGNEKVFHKILTTILWSRKYWKNENILKWIAIRNIKFRSWYLVEIRELKSLDRSAIEEFSFQSDSVTASDAIEVINSFPKLKKLHVGWFCLPYGEVNVSILENLEEFHDCSPPPFQLKVLVQHCRKLRCLHLLSMHSTQCTVSGSLCLAQICANNPHLCDLWINFEQIDDVFFLSIHEHCHNLVKLSVQCSRSENYETLTRIWKRRKIKEFEVQGLVRIEQFNTMTIQTRLPISDPQLQLLETLAVDGLLRLNDYCSLCWMTLGALKRILKASQHSLLWHVAYNRFRADEPEGIVEFLATFPNLTSSYRNRNLRL